MIVVALKLTAIYVNNIWEYVTHCNLKYKKTNCFPEWLRKHNLALSHIGDVGESRQI